MRSEPLPVAIIGAGFSGTMAAAQLARRGLASVLIEGGARAGRGIAYSTTEQVHLLNVPAECMSAWGADDDLLRFGAERGEFVSRQSFGTYLSAILAHARETGRVRLEAQQAVHAAPDGQGWRVELSGGESVAARALVLAQGNQPPEPLRGTEDLSTELFLKNPWSAHARARIAAVALTGEDVLILGTGLTMVDAVLSLEAAGHRGRIKALSRRGQMPRAHTTGAEEEADWSTAGPPAGLMDLWRAVRRRAQRGSWRAAVDSLRPHSQALWQGFSPEDRHRFLRHARPYWDVHRHRIAPQVARQLQDLIAADRLEIVAGRVERFTAEGGRLEARTRRRGADQATTSRYALGLNCTGPLGRIERTRDPLLQQMLRDGLVRPDPLGIGLQVDGAGHAGERLWALGPLTKGVFWEIVAVPDIRGQVSAVADAIAKELTQ